MSNIYLHDIPLDIAWNTIIHALEKSGLWQVLGHEVIPVDENALGRVLVEPMWAQISSPHYHASAMDGFALRGRGYFGCNANPSGGFTYE